MVQRELSDYANIDDNFCDALKDGVRDDITSPLLFSDEFMKERKRKMDIIEMENKRMKTMAVIRIILMFLYFIVGFLAANFLL